MTTFQRYVTLAPC